MSIARIVRHHVRMAKSITLSGRSILVPPGLSLKPIIEADLVTGRHEIGALEQGEKARVQMRLEYSEDAGRYEIARFGVDRRDLALEIGGTLLRTVKVHAIARRAIAYSLPIWTLGVIMLRDKRRTGELSGFEPFNPTSAETLHLPPWSTASPRSRTRIPRLLSQRPWGSSSAQRPTGSPAHGPRDS